MQLHQPCDKVVIGGAGLWTPEHVVTNEELVASLNAYADQFNDRYADQIASGEKEAVRKSDVDFIVKASGIKQRHVYIKDGILDIDRMKPRIPERKDDELSHQAEVALHAARRALESARKSPDDIDAVIVSCAYTERYYPAIAIEVQHALGIEGYAFDMLVACSAATFALHRAWEMVRTGSARSVLVINPELVTPQINFCDRDSHFIFGDVATAMVVERAEDAQGEQQFDILGAQAHTLYSNNIRSNFGYLSRGYDADPFAVDKLFHQEGRSVFKEVCPMAAQHLTDHLALHGFTPKQVRRWWLHQANINMNQLIAKRLLGNMPDSDVAPTVLDQYANTASAGSIIAFNLYHKDMHAGDIGMLCSFGAGYSIGSLLLQKK